VTGGDGFHLYTAHFYKSSERSTEVLKKNSHNRNYKKSRKIFYDTIQEDENKEG
jgi:hypothetical protein